MIPVKLSRALSALAGIPDTIREEAWLARSRTIRPGDLVLDIGSGGNPDLRANVLCDKFVADGTERHGTPVVVDRPFVAGDVEHLPFRDGAFDYIILSHVLEHLPQPERALAELQRVGRRGYIETPSAVYERLSGHPFHRWMVDSRDGVLTLRAKRTAICDPELREWFGHLLERTGARSRFWARRRQLDLYTCHEWEGEIRYQVDRTDLGSGDGSFEAAPEGLIASQVDAGAGARIRGPRDGGPLWRTQQWVSRRQRRHSDRPWKEIRNRLCCPACRGELTESDARTLRCTGCGGLYPVHAAGIPLLLLEYRQSPGISVARDLEAGVRG